MTNSNNKRQRREPVDPAAKLQREIKKNRREYEEFLDTLEEITSRPQYAAPLAEWSAKTGNPVEVEVLLMICEFLHEHGEGLPRKTQAHLMEHARMSPEQRKRLLSSLALN